MVAVRRVQFEQGHEVAGAVYRRAYGCWSQRGGMDADGKRRIVQVTGELLYGLFVGAAVLAFYGVWYAERRIRHEKELLKEEKVDSE